MAVRNSLGVGRETHDLGSDDELVTHLRVLGQIGADVPLSVTWDLARGSEGDGVDFCGVDEVHTAGDSIVELLMGVGLSVLDTPGHGAQTDFGHEQFGIAQAVVFHGGDGACGSGAGESGRGRCLERTTLRVKLERWLVFYAELVRGTRLSETDRNMPRVNLALKKKCNSV